MQKVSTCLWFDKEAEEAAEFYVSLLGDSKITSVSHSGEGGPGEPGSVLTVSFQLAGRDFIALNGGPHFKFNEAISIYVDCDSQEEVDELWAKLTEGGEESQCGWLKDRFGLSWQIIPSVLPELLQDKDEAKANNVMKAMLQMQKIDIAELQRAYEQPTS
jgi:predicted 3-demethylubiquinone-9 3-methyltransferase (glyoxalase superfamily)